MGKVATTGSKRWMYAYAAGAGAVIAVAVWTTLRLSRAEVEGSTPADRVRSICRLADERPRGAGEAIADAAVNAPAPAVRRAALIALGRFVSPEHRPAVEAGSRDRDPSVRAGAAMTLGEYDDDAAGRRLGELLGEDPAEEVRLAAVRGLSRMQRPIAIVLLTQALEDNDNMEVRQRVLAAMFRRLKARHLNPPKPDEPARWTKIVEMIRQSPTVKAASRSVSD